MTTFNTKLVDHLSSLANIPLDDAQKKALPPQLEHIIELIQTLQSVDTSKVIPTSQVTGLENVWREDIVEKSFTQEQALQNAPATYKGYFVVPAVLDQE